MIETHRVWCEDIQAILNLQNSGWTYREAESLDRGYRLVYQRETPVETGKPLYAFWKYDQFPFFLGGEVAEVLPDGSVRIVGYGGYSFVPVKLLPLKQGLDLHQKLADLKRDFRTEEALLVGTYMQKRSRIIEGVLE